MYQQGDFLMAQLRSSPEEGLANRLLDEFHQGFPVERLNELLKGDDPELVRIGAWIASELGGRSDALLDDLTRLTRDPQRYVRFYAIDAIAASGTTDPQPMAAVARSLWDEDAAVRWKGMRVLQRLTKAQLAAAASALEGSECEDIVRWMLAMTSDARADEVVSRLNSATRAERLGAAVVAAKLALSSPESLHRAAESPDSEVQSFAEDCLRELG